MASLRDSHELCGFEVEVGTELSEMAVLSLSAVHPVSPVGWSEVFVTPWAPVTAQSVCQS